MYHHYGAVIISVCFMLNMARSTAVSEIVLFGPKGNMTLYSSFLQINCSNRNTISEVVPPLSKTIDIHVDTVMVLYCAPPNKSYVEEFQALNINITGIENLYLTLEEMVPLPPGNYTVGLNISTMKLYSTKILDIFQNAPDFFDPLYNLNSLKLYGVRLPRIPETMHLKSLALSFYSTIVDWGTCQYLETLEFERTYLDINPIPEWPLHCSRLRNLHAQEVQHTLSTIESKLISAAPNLTSLSITKNYVTALPIEFLKKSQRLLHLSFAGSYFHPSFEWNFPVMNTLETIDVSRTQLDEAFLDRGLPLFPSLRYFYMNNTPNFTQPPEKDFFPKTHLACFLNIAGPLQQTPVEVMTFAGTQIPLIYFYSIRFQKLTLLDLSSTPSRNFRLMDLPVTNAKNLTIVLNKSFEEIYFDIKDYQELKQRNTTVNALQGFHHNHLTVIISFVDCDCKHGWLAQALRHFPNQISMPGLRCNYERGVSILNEDRETMECNKTLDNTSGCFLRQVWGSKEVDAECKHGIVPKQEHLRGLDVSGNNLTTFFSDLPSTVMWIDYRNNRLSSADQQAVDTIFLNGRKVWLAANEIICECHNRVLLDAIQQYSDQVEDYDELTCTGTGRLIKLESTAELCQTSLKILMMILGVLVGFTLILALAINRFLEEIKLFLYSQGWCLACLLHEDIGDKPYDAFISYAHGDDNYVRDVLVPGLENLQEKFRLCVHYRDWAVGGWIPDQIMFSVTHSKRTIIVLSKNFIKSKWSALEFRYALATASEIDSPRVLILILDDVLEVGNLSPELTGYLAFNTYLRCDDPWFWQKLRYAMPHKGKKKKEKRKEQERMDPEAVERELQAALQMVTFPSERLDSS